ncbi:peptide transport periplasmic protein SapA [Vibrio ponticus]|nr:peptide transport periplasmic protein SapA [Vibrio ponticus]
MRAFIQLTISFFAASFLTGCGEEISHEKARQNGFVFCGQAGPATFNPQLVDSGITSETLSSQLFDTLLTLDPTTYKPQPSIATSWQVNAAGTEYEFTLKQDVQFQTTDWFQPSRPLNADDVVFSFRRIIDPNHPFHLVGNGYPWFSGIDFQNLLVSVSAVDKHTVKFTLSKPDNTFLSNIATSHAVIHSKEYADQLQISDELNALDSHPVGTGPFYLDDYQVNDLVRLKRHDNYWQVKLRCAKWYLTSRIAVPVHWRNYCAMNVTY